MKKLIFFLLLCNTMFAMDKYQKEDILSIWKVDYKRIELIEHKEKNGLSILNSEKKQKELWDIILNFYPQEVVKKIDTFIVFADNNPANDGGMFGLIEPTDINNSSFIFSLDIEDSYYRGELNLGTLLPLLTHEFFHIISLDNSQISKNDTGGLKIFEGYAKRDSYLDRFYREFWENSFSKKLELLEYDASLSYKQKKEIRDRYFEKNSDKFVNSYSMTNVVEDIAVSFEEFIRLNKNHLRSDLKDKKIIFFYSYPQLIKYKKHFLEKRRELLKK